MMAKNTFTFNLDDLADLAKATTEMVEQEVLATTQKLALDVHKNIVLGCPVDSGELRKNWTVETPTKPYENGEISNSLEYAPHVSNGTKDRAPNTYVEDAIVGATKLTGGK